MAIKIDNLLVILNLKNYVHLVYEVIRSMSQAWWLMPAIPGPQDTGFGEF